VRDKPIEIIKWPKAGLEDLLISPCLSRRIRRVVKKNYWKDEQQIPPSSFNLSPTIPESKLTCKVEDYQYEAGIRKTSKK